MGICPEPAVRKHLLYYTWGLAHEDFFIGVVLVTWSCAQGPVRKVQFQISQRESRNTDPNTINSRALLRPTQLPASPLHAYLSRRKLFDL